MTLIFLKTLRRGLSTFGAPPAKATVTVHYTMFFENQDEPFDSSELRGRAERYKVIRLHSVTLATRVIPGLFVNSSDIGSASSSIAAR